MAETRALLIDVQESSKTPEIVATLGWVEELPFDDSRPEDDSRLDHVTQALRLVARGNWHEDLPFEDSRLDWRKVDIPKSKFAVLKGINIKHPDMPESTNIQLHPDAKFDIQITLALEEGEKILGFQFHEVKNPESGASELYHPQVLLCNGEATWLEPLSRHWFNPAPSYPGKVQWLPPTAGLGIEGSEVINLRAMQGSEYSHLVGVVYASSWSIQTLTGQSMFFWLDTVGLIFAMFYADIALDIKQLFLFYNNGLVDYCLFNGLGILIPPIVTMREALRWQHRPSPEKDFVNCLIKSEFLQKMFIVVVIVSGMHVFLLVMLSMNFRKKHPLLEAAKHAEVAESAVSAVVQTNFLMSVLVGVQSVASLDLSNADLQSMATSIGVSCCSAGLGFAARDKTDAAVLALPGKITWGPTMACLVLVRSLEVASRIIAFNLIQVSLRGTWFLGHASGPIAVTLYAAAAGWCFREAELADILAAVVAHPGQILAPHSLLPLRHSLMLHVLLALAAGVPQVLMRTEYRVFMPADAKEFPTQYLIGWLLITICSFMGLFLLSLYGSSLDHPTIAALCEEDGSILLSSFVTAFKSKDSQVPKAVAASLGNRCITVDTGNLTSDTLQELIDTECPVEFTSTTLGHLIRLFSVDFGDKAAPGEVMKRLRYCNMMSLNLRGCYLPAATWQQLRGAKWPRLKKANFYGCFSDQGKGAADLLEALGRCQELEDVNFAGCYRIPAAAWQQLRGAKWPRLKKANFAACFNNRGEGAADLLGALGHSQELEDVKISCGGFGKIPAAAWHCVPSGAWPKLRYSWGVPDEEKQRLRSNEGGLPEDDAIRPEPSEMAEDHRLPLAARRRLKTVIVCGLDSDKDAVELMTRLSFSHELEVVAFPGCRQIPAAAWQQLRGAKWPRLKKVDFTECFFKSGEGAADLLGALGHSQELEVVEFFGCSEIPAAAWQQLRGAKWPRLKKANFNECFTKSGEGAADLLGALGRCEDLEGVAFPACRQIPAAAWQQLRGAKWPRLKKANFYGCFKDQGEGAADLLEALGRWQDLEDMDFRRCSEIPAAAWQQLRGVKWPRLKKANFGECLASGPDLLGALGRCQDLEDVNFAGCYGIPAAAWQQLRGAKWPRLKKANFYGCFTNQGKGAADLLGALGRCQDLEDMDLRRCSEIPAAAWQQLRGVKWPKLNKANLGECFIKSGEGAADLLGALGHSQELETIILEASSVKFADVGFGRCSEIPAAAWQQLRGAKWPGLKKANFGVCFTNQGKGAADLLGALGRCQDLEDMDFRQCSEIPAAAWQQLRGAKWPRLKKANFYGCFIKSGEGAADLLGALGHSQELEDVEFGRCSEIPAAAWQQLRGAKWPRLKKADFTECFIKSGEGAADLLGALGHSQELEDVIWGYEMIPAAAWHCLPSGAWPKLRSDWLRGIPEEERRRLLGDAVD